VPSARSSDHDLEGLRARLSELDAESAEQSATASRAQADLAAFKARYRHEVGQLHIAQRVSRSSYAASVLLALSRASDR